jgi:hypothetical protein
LPGHFSVEIPNDNKKDYRYNPSRALVDDNGNLLRAYFPEEMTRVIEISEGVLNPGKTNARDIPSFLFFDSRASDRPICPQVTIPAGTNKYYCGFRSLSTHLGDDGNLSGNYPDNPIALQNIIYLHSVLAIKEIQEKNHELPMTIVYQIGMNNNHMGIAALRICSITNPSQNEIMVINSLNGYSQWENAAVNGISDALKKATKADKEKNPKKIIITPNRHDGITQASCGMRGSCAGITAAMSCAITPYLSFADQEKLLVKYMRTLCGKENEAALRRDHQKLLVMSGSLDDANRKIATDVLSKSERHKGQLPELQKYWPQQEEELSKNQPEQEQIVPDQCHQEFNNAIHVLQDKIDDFKQRAHFDTDQRLKDAHKAAKTLYNALKNEGNHYFTKEPTSENYENFKKNCKEHIKEARGVLDEHRGWKKILFNVFAMIISAGVGYALAAGINIAIKGRFTFFSTDSSEKLYDIEEHVFKNHHPNLLP